MTISPLANVDRDKLEIIDIFDVPEGMMIEMEDDDDLQDVDHNPEIFVLFLNNIGFFVQGNPEN